MQLKDSSSGGRLAAALQLHTLSLGQRNGGGTTSAALDLNAPLLRSGSGADFMAAARADAQQRLGLGEEAQSGAEALEGVTCARTWLPPAAGATPS